MGPVPLHAYASEGHPRLSAEDMARISREVVQAGQEVITRKGATYYAIAMSVTRIIKVIVNNEDRVLCVSSYIENMHGVDDVCLSLPAFIGRDGIRELLAVPLTPEETLALQRSAGVLKAMLREVEYQ